MLEKYEEDARIVRNPLRKHEIVGSSGRKVVWRGKGKTVIRARLPVKNAENESTALVLRFMQR